MAAPWQARDMSADWFSNLSNIVSLSGQSKGQKETTFVPYVVSVAYLWAH